MLSNRYLANWYSIGIFLMILMIAIGGITRLTNSGLSMVDWEPISGIIPPISDEDWENEFNSYKRYPEYKEINNDINISEFKVIYFWEYLHRMIGRILGLFFICPLLYYSLNKSITIIEIRRVLTIIFLILCQGLLGWYMVKSGLKNNPYVDHIRLMLHFMMAMVLISYTYIQYLRNIDFKRDNLILSYKSSILLFIIILIQIIFGAFTAGLKAGYIFNTYPLMNGTLFPADILYNSSMGLLGSIINNHATVQYIHRTLGLIIVLWSFYILLHQYKKKHLSSYDTKLSILLIIQFILGVITLVTSVDIYYAILHQINASFVILVCIRVIYINKSNNI